MNRPHNPNAPGLSKRELSDDPRGAGWLFRRRSVYSSAQSKISADRSIESSALNTRHVVPLSARMIYLYEPRLESERSVKGTIVVRSCVSVTPTW